MLKSIFRAYDIRGIVDEYLTEDLMYKLGIAFSRSAKHGKMVVGRDGRHSSERLSEALICGLMKEGSVVYDIGLVPTPVLYFAINYLGTANGLMITGSHNPVNYNGVKMVQGYKSFFDSSIQDLYQAIENMPNTQYSKNIDKKPIVFDVVAPYCQRIISNQSLETKFTIAIDPANGATAQIASNLYTELGYKVSAINNTVDGSFPSHHPDPSNPENLQQLQKEVVDTRSVVGIAFDGDGDRLGVLDSNGRIIMIDDLLAIFSEDILAKHPNGSIVFDVKCSPRLEETIRTLKGKPIMSRTGHSFIKNTIVEENALLGGEMSGHIFFNDSWYGFDDSIYSGVRLLNILSQPGMQSKLLSVPTRACTHELQIYFEEGEQINYIERFTRSMADTSHEKISYLDGVRVEYPFGWGLVRASNTTPSIVMRFEGEDKKSLERVMDIFRKKLIATDNNIKLPF